MADRKGKITVEKFRGLKCNNKNGKEYKGKGIIKSFY